jgi:hypothetical protein
MFRMAVSSLTDMPVERFRRRMISIAGVFRISRRILNNMVGES